MLELMARSCMRVGEVLKLKPGDIEDRKVIIRDHNSGKVAEVAFLPQKVANRLQKYISDNGIKPEDRIFPVTYAAARIIVKNTGDLVGIYLKSHDLRGHATTYASRSERRLKSFRRSCFAIRTCRPPKISWKNQRCRGNIGPIVAALLHKIVLRQLMIALVSSKIFSHEWSMFG